MAWGSRLCRGSAVASSRCWPWRWLPGRWDRPPPIAASAPSIRHPRTDIAPERGIRTGCLPTTSSRPAWDRRLVHFCITAMRRRVSTLIFRLAGRHGGSCRPGHTDREPILMRSLKGSAAILAPLMLLNACATEPMGPTIPVMPAPGKPFEAFESDQAVCKQFASSQVAGRRAAGEQPTGWHRRHRHSARRRSGGGRRWWPGRGDRCRGRCDRRHRGRRGSGRTGQLQPAAAV